MSQRLLVISPVYNEAPYIERVVAAVAEQRRPPDRWLIVDDGSTDGTLELLQTLEPQVPFLEVLGSGERPEGPVEKDRLGVALEARAFNRGLALVGDRSTFTHIGKLDGDIELPPEWFDVLLTRLAAEPALGLVGGTLIEPSPAGWERLAIPQHHVHGALKLYSRDCFEQVGGIQERLGWDSIDETYARMRGYETRSYRDLVARHLRPAASAEGQLRGRARHGECAWILHYPVSWVLARSLKMATLRPRVLSGLWFVYGYFAGNMRRTPQVDDPQFRAFTRQELRERIRRPVARLIARIRRWRKP